MSHIVSFSIEGLVGRKGIFQRTLNRDTNIFFGVNGGGKTSLLKILHSAMTGDADILRSVPFERAEVTIFSNNRQKTFRRTFNKSSLQRQTIAPIATPEAVVSNEIETVPQRSLFTHLDITSYWTGYDSVLKWICPDEEVEKGVTFWKHSYLPTSRLYLTDDNRQAAYATGAAQVLSEEQLDRYFSKAMDTLWLRYAADILSAVRLAQETGLARLLRNILSPTEGITNKDNLGELDPQLAYQRVESFLKRQGSSRTLGSVETFKKRYRREHRLRSVVAEIDAVEQGIEKAMAPRLQLEQLIRKMFSGNKSILFTDRAINVTTDQNEAIGLEALSSGEKHLLRLFVEILLAENNSMLVDEPELSLHISWQRELISNFHLLNKDAQLIFATHSPEIMAVACPPKTQPKMK
jgi:ABC-type cobalamin/Fe3+-siderophores transport system ATPase subunit